MNRTNNIVMSIGGLFTTLTLGMMTQKNAKVILICLK